MVYTTIFRRYNNIKGEGYRLYSLAQGHAPRSPVAYITVQWSPRGPILYRIKPEELYILSCGKGRGRMPWPFPQLRM